MKFTNKWMVVPFSEQETEQISRPHPILYSNIEADQKEKIHQDYLSKNIHLASQTPVNHDAFPNMKKVSEGKTHLAQNDNSLFLDQPAVSNEQIKNPAKLAKRPAKPSMFKSTKRQLNQTMNNSVLSTKRSKLHENDEDEEMIEDFSDDDEESEDRKEIKRLFESFTSKPALNSRRPKTRKIAGELFLKNLQRNPLKKNIVEKIIKSPQFLSLINNWSSLPS